MRQVAQGLGASLVGPFDRVEKKISCTTEWMQSAGCTTSRAAPVAARLLQPSHPWIKAARRINSSIVFSERAKRRASRSREDKKKKNKRRKRERRRLPVDQENATPRVNAIHLGDLRRLRRCTLVNAAVCGRYFSRAPRGHVKPANMGYPVSGWRRLAPVRDAPEK